MPVRIFIRGDLACFTRSEMRSIRLVQRDHPPAGRGVLEAIYWKPQIRWVIDRLHILRPIRFTNLRRNEVGAKASTATTKTAMKSGARR